MKKQFLIVLFVITSLNAQNIPQFITVQGGSFIMGDNLGIGDDDEQPTHQVTLSTYQISKTEVTVAQYRKYCNSTGVSMPIEPSFGWQNNYPIVNVSWNDAINYCNWLSDELNKNITLPTEAQWEFAARGGNKNRDTKYAGGLSIESVGWYKINSERVTHSVASKKANELGLYDMSGNVSEWCLDWYDKDYYNNSPSKNPKNTKRNNYKVLRGGSWAVSVIYCRVSFRNSSTPLYRHIDDGFRVASF